jgi:glycolate oxidase iron-sulfur subunit
MQTNFTAEQLQNPHTAEANKILRNCVHCGFCTATCPTYVLLGDELDSPRGRIYLIKNMLEKNEAATKETVKHIDRCLSCLACMTTCPSGVNYMHLIDQARVHVEKTYRRPVFENCFAPCSALPCRVQDFRLALTFSKFARRFRKVSKLGLKRVGQCWHWFHPPLCLKTGCARHLSGRGHKTWPRGPSHGLRAKRD